MNAAVLKNCKFITEDIEKPILNNQKGAIVKVIGCGLCGSDIVKLKTGLAKDGAVLGHEVVGEIVELNTDTTFKLSDKVAMGHHIPCFKCEYCINEHYSMCKHFKETNIFPGGFSEFIFVSEEHLKNTVFKINEHLTDIEASFLEPLACCIRAVKRANIHKNSRTLIIGLGSIGLLMGQAVKAYENEVYGCDLLDDRVTLAKKYGFDNSYIINSTKDLYNYRYFDNIFLTAGASSAVDYAVNAAKDGGNIIVFSSIKDNNGFINNEIYYRELTVMGSYSPSPMDLKESMNLLDSKRVRVEGLSTVYPLENLNNAIDDTISNKIMKAYITI